MGALTYRARITQRNAFDEIYIYSSRRAAEEPPLAMDLSDSDGEESSHKESAITFNQKEKNNS